jgi:hypothetical protein
VINGKVMPIKAIVAALTGNWIRTFDFWSGWLKR